MFSGSATAHTCRTCGRTYAAYLPTSLIPFAVVTAAAVAGWGGLLSELIPSTLGAMAASLVLAPGSLVLALWGLAWWGGRHTAGGRCAACGGPLAVTGGGFVEASRPSRGELGLYAVVAALPWGLVGGRALLALALGGA